MFPNGSFNPLLPTSNLSSDLARLRLANIDVVLAVAEVSTELPLQIGQHSKSPVVAKVVALNQDKTTAGEYRLQVEIAGKTLWVNTLQKFPPGAQIALQLTDHETLHTPTRRATTSIATTVTTATTATTVTTADAATQLSSHGLNTGTKAVPNPAAVITTVPQNVSAAGTQTNVPAKFSPLGNLINQLLAHIAEQPARPAQLAPLLSEGSSANDKITLGGTVSTQLPTQKLAEGMHHAVEKSGLFYESHLTAWVNKQRSVEQLRQEPQAKLDMTSFVAPGAATDSSKTSLPITTREGNTLLMPDKLLPILREQMQVLEQRQFSAEVEVWPQQKAYLTIADEQAPPAERDTVNLPRWRAQLTLHLPHLGTVEAVLQLHGQDIQLTLQTDNPVSATQLRTQGIELQQGMQRSGLCLLPIKVQDHGRA